VAKQKKQASAQQPIHKAANGFVLKYPALWLILAIIVVYIPALNLGFTELDDKIFINELHTYNENLSNLLVSFQRGVFDPTHDIYYRPLFLNAMLLNYQLSGDSAMGYHVINIVFHIIAVVLLFGLLKKLKIKELHAFILSLFFAIHPVLSQAVAWIPGRNDTLLAIFTISFLISTINYTEQGKPKWLVLGALFLLCAFLTKETAIFSAPVAFVLIVFLLQKNWLDKRNIIQYAIWLLVIGIWYIMRANASLEHSMVNASQIQVAFIKHLPELIQYLGKVILPFNLSVFPIVPDTVIYYGIAAIIIIGLLLYFSKEKNDRVIWGGLIVFLLFLLPALIVPITLNDQAFEHRLYLPMIGILLVLSQTIWLKNKLTDMKLILYSCILFGVFSVINVLHQQDFNNPITFWRRAYESSPHSAYATMMYGERIVDENKPLAFSLVRKSYEMDSTAKYINYYYGAMLVSEDSISYAERYFLKEKKISDFFECDMRLAQIYVTKNDFPTAERYLESYIHKDPLNPMANNNLLLIYVQQKEKQKALQQIKNMGTNGLPVNYQIAQQANSL